jgi:acyl carrier protein
MAATIEKLREILALTSNDLAFEINDSDSLHSQGVDSLDLMDFYLNIEDEYGIQIPDTDVDGLLSLKDFMTYVNGKL